MTERYYAIEHAAQVADVLARAQYDEYGRLVPAEFIQGEVAVDDEPAQMPVPASPEVQPSVERTARAYKIRRALFIGAVYLAPLVVGTQVGDAALSHRSITDVNLIADAPTVGRGVADMVTSVTSFANTVNHLTGGGK